MIDRSRSHRPGALRQKEERHRQHLSEAVSQGPPLPPKNEWPITRVQGKFEEPNLVYSTEPRRTSVPLWIKWIF